MLLVPLTEGRRARFGDRLVLLARTAAYANRAHDFSSALQRYAACEDHDAAFVRGVDTKEVAARLREGRQIPGGNIEGTRGECLLDRNVDAAEPRAVHAYVSDEIASAVRNSDVHGLANCRCFLLRGVFHFHCIVQSQHRGSLKKKVTLPGISQPHYAPHRTSCD